jgi:hypothetical protein
MPVKIKSTSGSVTLDAQNVSGDQTLTVPSIAGGKTLLTTDGDGSSLTGIVHGVDGITSSANATAITIDSSEDCKFSGDVVIGDGRTGPLLDIGGASAGTGSGRIRLLPYGSTYYNWQIDSGYTAGGLAFAPSTAVGGSTFSTSTLELKQDGRGLSQFTAKAWINFNGTGTIAIRDSHNISSIYDNSTGNYSVNFDNNLPNANYSVVSGSSDHANNYNIHNSLDLTNVGYFVITHYEYSTPVPQDTAMISAIVFGDS